MTNKLFNLLFLMIILMLYILGNLVLLSKLGRNLEHGRRENRVREHLTRLRKLLRPRILKLSKYLVEEVR